MVFLLFSAVRFHARVLDSGKEVPMVRNVYDTCRVIYAGKLVDGEPTKSMRNSVYAMCEGGKIKTAFKVGRRWMTDLEREGELYGSC